MKCKFLGRKFLLLMIVFLIVSCDNGVRSARDECKYGDRILQNGSRQERDEQCSLFLIFESRKTDSNKFQYPYYNEFILTCLIAQKALDECDKRTTFPFSANVINSRNRE